MRDPNQGNAEIFFTASDPRREYVMLFLINWLIYSQYKVCI